MHSEDRLQAIIDGLSPCMRSVLFEEDFIPTMSTVKALWRRGLVREGMCGTERTEYLDPLTPLGQKIRQRLFQDKPGTLQIRSVSGWGGHLSRRIQRHIRIQYRELPSNRPGVWRRSYRSGGIVYRASAYWCQDCGADAPRIFIVQSWLWNEICPDNGIICIDCFEKRLGRRLVLSDLKNLPINQDLVLHQQVGNRYEY